MNLQILDFRLLRGDKPTRAFCDVRIGDITVRDFRIYQTNGKPSVRNPFSSYKDHNGILRFREIISFPVTVQTEINALILNDYYHRVKESRNGKHQ
jgi:hypothetical protein